MLELFEVKAIDKLIFDLFKNYNIDIENFEYVYEFNYRKNQLFLFVNFIKNFRGYGHYEEYEFYRGYAYYKNKIYKAILFHGFDTSEDPIIYNTIILRGINNNEIISFQTLTEQNYSNYSDLIIKTNKIKKVRILVSNKNLIKLFDLLYNNKIYELAEITTIDRIYWLDNFYQDYIITNVRPDFYFKDGASYYYLSININKSNKSGKIILYNYFTKDYNSLSFII